MAVKKRTKFGRKIIQYGEGEDNIDQEQSFSDESDDTDSGHESESNVHKEKSDLDPEKSDESVQSDQDDPDVIESSQVKS